LKYPSRIEIERKEFVTLCGIVLQGRWRIKAATVQAKSVIRALESLTLPHRANMLRPLEDAGASRNKIPHSVAAR